MLTVFYVGTTRESSSVLEAQKPTITITRETAKGSKGPVRKIIDNESIKELFNNWGISDEKDIHIYQEDFSDSLELQTLEVTLHLKDEDIVFSNKIYKKYDAVSLEDEQNTIWLRIARVCNVWNLTMTIVTHRLPDTPEGLAALFGGVKNQAKKS